MSLVLEQPKTGNYLPSATLKQGLHAVVISNIEDLGLVALDAVILAKNQEQARKEGRDPSTVKTAVPKARIFFSNSAGDFIAKDYTVSLYETAGLKKDLDAIGHPLKYGDSLLSLIGVNAQLMAVAQTSKKGTRYVKIGTLIEPAAGQNVPIPVVRPTTAATKKGGSTSSPIYTGAVTAATPINDNDIPF
jgi:hypothetical protein